MSRAITVDDPRISRLLDYIIQYKTANDGLAPSMAQISADLGLSTPGLANHYLRLLVKFGKIRLTGNGTARGIIVTGGCWQYRPVQDVQTSDVTN